MIIIVAGELIIYVSANRPFLQVPLEKENKKIPAEAGIFKLSTKPKGFADRRDAACCSALASNDARTFAG